MKTASIGWAALTACLFIFRQRGLRTGGGSATTGDANGDLDLDGEDLLIWKQQFGNSNLAATVPEPGSWPLALLAGLAIRVFSRHRSAGRA